MIQASHFLLFLSNFSTSFKQGFQFLLLSLFYPKDDRQRRADFGEKTHTLYMLEHQYSIVTKMSQEKHRGREKAKMFQTHIYDPELNCLSLCNSQSFLLQAGGEQSARSVILPSVSSYIHPSDLELRFQGLHYRD